MALRIGPVGPVREAGLGPGAGLGSEALRRAAVGAAVCCPLPLPQCRLWCPSHSLCISSLHHNMMLPVAVAPYQMRPPAPRAPPLKARRCGGSEWVSGLRKGTPSNHAVVHGLSFTGVAPAWLNCRPLLLPEPLCCRLLGFQKPREAGGGGGALGIQLQGSDMSSAGMRERESGAMTPRRRAEDGAADEGRAKAAACYKPPSPLSCRELGPACLRPFRGTR